MLRETVEIINELGLHARAAAKFVECTAHFESSFKIRKESSEVDGKSIMSVMMLAAGKGTVLDIQIDLRSAKSRSLFAQAGSRCLEIDETIRHLLPKSQLAKKTVHLMCWYLPRGGEGQLIYRARLLERGIYRIGPTRIATGFPLGLIRHGRILDQGDRVVVFPPTGRLLSAF